MEDQAKYHVKERPYHGSYTTTGQGKRPKQYEASIIIFAYMAAALFGLFFFIGLYSFGKWVWTLIAGA